MGPPADATEGCASKKAMYAATNSGTMRSSSSMMATMSPVVSAMPRLRAHERPCRVSDTRRSGSPGCAVRNSSKRAAVSSVELLSTTTHSHSAAGAVCAATARSVVSNCSARL